MKKIFITIVLFCGVYASYSQGSLSLSNGSESITNGALVSMECNPNILEAMHLNVTNNSATTKSVKVKKYMVKYLPGASVSFCWSICVDTSTAISPMPLTIAAGATNTKDFTADFEGNGNIGYAIAAFTFFDETNVNDSIMVNIRFNSGTSGVNNIKSNKINLNFYPNPAKNFINISTEDLSYTDIIEIKSITGKTLIKTNVINEKNGYININTENLNSGIYMLSIIRNNIIVKTEKLIIN